MNPRDKRLGMDRAITRREFLNGVSVTIGASLLPACAIQGEAFAENNRVIVKSGSKFSPGGSVRPQR